MTLRQWAVDNGFDPKSRKLQHILVGYGILQHNGLPTRSQRAQGNLYVSSYRSIGRRYAPCIMLSWRGRQMLDELFKAKEGVQ